MNKEVLNRRVQDFVNEFCPFGWLDIQAGIEFLDGYKHGYSDLIDAVNEFQDSTGIDIKEIDVTYVAYDLILQTVRNQIEDIINFDICNDAGFYTAGNYCATSFDFSSEDKELLKKAILEADEEKRQQLFDDEEIKEFLSEIDLLSELKEVRGVVKSRQSA